MADPMKLVVLGAGGRMGRTLVRAVAETEGAVLHAALERPGSALIGQDAGVVAELKPLGVAISEDALQAVVGADGVLDFTMPEASVAMAALCAQARIAHVLGTTGFSPADEAAILAAARHAMIVKSGNMSLGVNLLAGLVRQAAAALGDEWDIEIVEMHHRMKVDAPSGTALLLGEAAAKGRGVTLAERRVAGRDGHTGARQAGDIGFASLRGGSVVGDHSVIFATQGERIELSHRAEDRSLFARGAVKAALWARGRKPGLYGMADVLGFTA
jgi:4-hydroxy-tetrahydrodipicolinate reductase